MRLELLDVDRFVERNKILEVKTARIEGKLGKLDEEGLFSEIIFNRLGSPSRKTTFGFINLNTKIIHPEIFDLISTLSPEIGKFISSKKKYTITPDGELDETPSEFAGFSGVKDLIDNWDKLDLKKIGKKKPEIVKFLTKNRERIFIDKILVLPAGIRDIQQSKMSNKTMITSSEINKLYDELLQNTKIIDSSLYQNLDPETITMIMGGAETVRSVVNAIQRKCVEINNWIRDKLKGKGGILRGGLLSKTIDYTARSNIVGDPTLNFGEIGVPWQIILKLYEPFTFYQILNNPFNQHVKEMIASYLNIEKKFGETDLKRFIAIIAENPESLSAELTDELVRIAQTIAKDKFILYKNVYN